MRRVLITISLAGLISLCLFPSQIAAQYRFDNWTTDEGLPQNSVSAIRQTRDGYLWLTTAAGLVRFDGLRFTVFDKSNTKGLTSVRFTSLCEDDEGNLWIGTEDGGLTRYRNGVFATYTTQDGLPHNRILAIWKEEQGGILILTGNGLVRWRHEQFMPYTVPAGISIDQGCYRVQSGAFWCAQPAGLHRIKDDQISTYTIRDGLSSLSISAVYEDRQGNVWIGTANAGLNRLQQGQFTHYTTKDGVPEEPIRSIYQDRQGNLWMLTRGGRLGQFQNGRFVTYATTDPSGEGKFVVSFYAVGSQGNASDRGYVDIWIDKTPPTIGGEAKGLPNKYGWYNKDVTATFNYFDGSDGPNPNLPVSGIDELNSTRTAVLSTEGADQAIIGKATDNAGNVKFRPLIGFSLDKTAPTVTYSNNPGNFSVDQFINITCTPADNLSGVRVDTCENISGEGYSFVQGTQTVTPHAYSAQATDYADNVGNGATSFTVTVTQQAVSNLTARFVSNAGISNSLQQKLRAAAEAEARGDLKGKAQHVSVYIHELQNHIGKFVSAQNAAVLIRLAQAF